MVRVLFLVSQFEFKKKNQSYFDGDLSKLMESSLGLVTLNRDVSIQVFTLFIFTVSN